MILAVLMVLGRPQAQPFYAPSAVAANLLSKGVRCGLSQKKTPRDSTNTYSPRGLAFWDVPQIAAFHNKFLVRTLPQVQAPHPPVPQT